MFPLYSQFYTKLKLGKDSGRIVIWNMGPVVDKEKENDENAPKILCRMDHHYCI
jgi:hypothetical protein